ncbi:MAG TPA: polyketide cyclase, partial [Sphingobacterium sp.]|nr:polyketide cyclase [Sphingobacterium sp.]
MIMKILKKILIVLAIIIAIPLITAIFVSKDFSAQSEITINKPKQEVFNYVKMLKNQDNFGVWQLSDPQMKKTEQGVDG